MLDLICCYKPLEPGSSIHCNWTSNSPHSTFLNLRQISWTTFPPFQTMLLSSAKQFCLLGCILVIIVPLGRSCRFILSASMYGLMSISASPILSSKLNVSWSYTVCDQTQNQINTIVENELKYWTKTYFNNG